MADATLAVANAILKEDYLGPLRSALNKSTPVYSRLVKNTRDIVGRQAWIPVEFNIPQGAGARGENETLPVAQPGEYQEVKVPLKYYYGTLSLTGQSMRQTAKGDRGSFGRMVDIEAKGMKSLLSLVLAHDFWKGAELGETIADTGGGGDGIIELVANSNMHYFYVGMVVDVLDAAGGLIAGHTGRIASIDKTPATPSITLVDPTTGAAMALTEVVNGSVVRTGTVVGGVSRCVTSMDEIIGTGTLFGVNPATQPKWQANVAAHAGAAFDKLELQELLDNTVSESGKQPTAIYSDFAMQREYFKTLVANPQYQATSPPEVLDGGFKKLMYTGGGAPMAWIADRLCPAQTLYMPYEPDLQVFSPKDFDFIDIGGDVWLPDIMGSSPRDAYKAVLQRDIELGCTMRNSHAKLTGVPIT